MVDINKETSNKLDKYKYILSMRNTRILFGLPQVEINIDIENWNKKVNGRHNDANR